MSTKNAEPPQQRIRDKSGRFVKGQTGCSNSPGRPKLREEFKTFAQDKSFEALQVVYSIMKKTETSGKDAIAAARLLMEYGYGRPAAEYDKERLELDKRRLDADLQEKSDNQARSIEVIISDQAKEWGK